MPTKKQEEEKETIANNNLPILYVDDVSTGHREDGMNYLSFTTNIPDVFVEQVRLIIDDEHLKQIIDTLCKTANHYPRKPSKRKKDTSE